MDNRYHSLQTWLSQHFRTEFSLKPLAGDASFRRYFRAQQGARSFVVMDAPPDQEDIMPFVAIAKALRARKVHTPEIIATDAQQGFVLMSDLGDKLYLPLLNKDTVSSLYHTALTTLPRMLPCQAIDQWSLPAFDQAMILREINLFVEWFLHKHLNLQLSRVEVKLLEATFAQLINSALEQPQYFVHRDYHSRNLLQLPNGEVGVIDFQDAVIGPITYDAVSLLKDCYIVWPEQQVKQWALDYQQLLLSEGLLHETSSEKFLQWFDWIGLQRHIKVIGIFHRLHYRDHKSQYLQDIPRVVNYVKSVVQTYPQLHDFNLWLNDRIFASVST